MQTQMSHQRQITNAMNEPDKLRLELGLRISVGLDITRREESHDEDKDIGFSEELSGPNLGRRYELNHSMKVRGRCFTF